MTYKHYPMCGANFFRWGMEELGHEVFSVGYFSGDVVPWAGNPRYPDYVFPPDLALPRDVTSYPLDLIKDKVPWKPDLILEIDAGFYMDVKPKEWKDVPIAMFATDPHFLDYTIQYGFVDYFFNPQPMAFDKYPQGIFLPWAHDPSVHKTLPATDKDYDIVFVGAMYEQRKHALDRLAEKYKVYASSFIIYDECTEIYNKGKISFNWSSKDDIPMRIFEGMAYGNAVVTNRLTGLDLLFKEGKHYIGFSDEDELMEKMDYYLTHEKELTDIAFKGYLAIEEHTYKNRCAKILKEVFHG